MGITIPTNEREAANTLDWAITFLDNAMSLHKRWRAKDYEVAKDGKYTDEFRMRRAQFEAAASQGKELWRAYAQYRAAHSSKILDRIEKYADACANVAGVGNSGEFYDEGEDVEAYLGMALAYKELFNFIDGMVQQMNKTLERVGDS